MRKIAIPRAEIQVLKRLREARERLGLTQPDFAKAVRMSRGQLANYEYLKAPLPFGLGMRICHHYIIGERWLATGKGPFRQLMDLGTVPSRYLTNFHDPTPDTRFSFLAAYNRFYATYAEKTAVVMEQTGELFKVNMGAADIDRPFVQNYLSALIEQWMSKLDNEAKLELLCGYLAKEGTAYVSKLANLKVEYDWESTKRYFIDPTGKREEIEPFGDQRDTYLNESMEDIVKGLLAHPEVTEAAMGEELRQKEAETHAQLATYVIKHRDDLRKTFAEDPEALKNFDILIDQHKGVRREPAEETVLATISPDAVWDLAHVGPALEMKRHLAEVVGKNISKIRKTLPKKSEELAEVESFFKLVQADKSSTSLENFSAVQAAKLIHILRALRLIDKKVADLAEYDGPYPGATKKGAHWNQ